MTVEEVLESWNRTAKPKDDFEKEAYEIIRNALEKQIPMKVIILNKKHPMYVQCPACERIIDKRTYRYGCHCEKCGQKLDWSVEE